MLADVQLYLRATATLVRSWEEYARHATAAALVRSVGVAIAVFGEEPKRAVYNNALLEGDLEPLERADAIDAMEATYAHASITSFAAWVHESDEAMRADLERRGYTVAESTRAMGMTLDDVRLPPPEIVVARADWMEHLRVGELSTRLLSNGDHAAFHILVGRLDGENVATAMAFDSGTDCGIYNVGTQEHARRRGLGTALTVAHLHEAVGRGCRTASLQSTKMAERMYAAVGFRDLGRILEFAPPT
jgi:ribosomal protein S18 acetylase RimI-like enzyme